MQSLFAESLRDAGRLAHFWSRADFRKLPLEFILVPSLDGPLLVHDERTPLFTDPATGRICAALPMLTEQRLSYPRTPDPIKRALFARALRELWVQLVDQADFYAFADSPQALYDFAPDEVC